MSNIPLQRGMWIRHQGHIYEVADFSERHTGKQRPTVHVALRDVRDARPVDRTLDDLLPIEEVEHARRTMQHTYASGDGFVFMDSDTFEEHTLGKAQLAGREAFLVEGEQYSVTCIEGRPMRVELADIVVLTVANTAPAGHSVGSAANVTKEATLENGLEIRVPLFIKTGDAIKVDTRTKAYAGKDHGA